MASAARSLFRLLIVVAMGLRLAGYFARSFRDDQLRFMLTKTISTLDEAGLVSFLDWSSLGGFEDEASWQRASNDMVDASAPSVELSAWFSDSVLRKAFAALDDDDDGVIAIDDMVEAINEATRAEVQRMEKEHLEAAHRWEYKSVCLQEERKRLMEQAMREVCKVVYVNRAFEGHSLEHRTLIQGHEPGGDPDKVPAGLQS